jgi:hypothetical protein
VGGQSWPVMSRQQAALSEEQGLVVLAGLSAAN